jgi:hypothetical protein
MRANVQALTAATVDITESEEFKRTCAQVAEVAFVLLKPIILAGAASQGGPAAGLLAVSASHLISNRLHALATKGV